MPGNVLHNEAFLNSSSPLRPDVGQRPVGSFPPHRHGLEEDATGAALNLMALRGRGEGV